MVEKCRLEARVRTTDVNTGALCIANDPVEDLRAEWASFTGRAEQRQAERDTLAICVLKLKGDAAARTMEIRAIIQAGQSFKERFVAGKACARMAEAPIQKVTGNMFKPR